MSNERRVFSVGVWPIAVSVPLLLIGVLKSAFAYFELIGVYIDIRANSMVHFDSNSKSNVFAPVGVTFAVSVLSALYLARM